MDHFKKKRPTMAQQQWWFHWDKCASPYSYQHDGVDGSEGDPGEGASALFRGFGTS
jgi:hypothetical protein